MDSQYIFGVFQSKVDKKPEFYDKNEEFYFIYPINCPVYSFTHTKRVY